MISIVIPCYNCETTLETTLESAVRNQGSFEVVLVNDGSTDHTGELCGRWKKRDQRIRVIHQENKGLMAAWKTGVRHAEGDYIVFSDSDDWIEPDLIHRVENVAEENKPDIITYGITMNYPDGSYEYQRNHIRAGLIDRKEIESGILPVYFYDNGMGTMAVMSGRWCKAVRRELLLDNMHLLDDRISIGEDDVTSFALILDAQSVYQIEGYFPYHYCRRKGSMLGNYNVDVAREFVRVREELHKIAEVKGYGYRDQIDKNFIENVLLVIKKIMVDMEYDPVTMEDQVRQTAGLEEVASAFHQKALCSCFGRKEKLMISLINGRHYKLCAFLARTFSKLKGISR